MTLFGSKVGVTANGVKMPTSGRIRVARFGADPSHATSRTQRDSPLEVTVLVSIRPIPLDRCLP